MRIVLRKGGGAICVDCMSRQCCDTARSKKSKYRQQNVNTSIYSEFSTLSMCNNINIKKTGTIKYYVPIFLPKESSKELFEKITAKSGPILNTKIIFMAENILERWNLNNIVINAFVSFNLPHLFIATRP